MAQAGGRLQPRPQNPRGRGKDGGFFWNFRVLSTLQWELCFQGRKS